MKLHRFNDQGTQRFNDYLDALVGEPASKPPNDLLIDPACVEIMPPGVEIEQCAFASRMEFAKYIDRIFSFLTKYNTAKDVGLWSWLALFYFDQICPPDGNAHRKLKNRARYIPVLADFQRYYRHLLAGPYLVFRAHRDDPDRALVLLCGPLHKPGDIVEQLVSRQEIITNPNAVGLATTIYYDGNKGSFRRGAAGKGHGSARRFADILSQFDVTWDLYWMQSDSLLTKLPREFDRFRSATKAS